MSAPASHELPYSGAAAPEPYHDDPTMASAKFDEPRSPALHSPPIHHHTQDSDAAAGPPLLTIRNSVPLIPTPGTISKRHPAYEPILLRFWLVAFLCIFMGAVGVGLEVARVISRDNNGFHVHEKNVFAFSSFSSVQFLTSFFPALLFVPMAYTVRAIDQYVLMWNPFLLLSRGHATAEETLLTDYLGCSRPVVYYKAFKFRHRFVLVSGATTLAALLFQPLAGSILSVKQLPSSSAATAQNIRAIGLSPDIADLSSFAASAGFAEAAVFNRIGDPSFVDGGWAIAEFVFPTNTYLNGTMAINTTGIRTNVNCARPNQVSVTPSTTLLTISATSIDGCTLQVSVNPTDSAQQYGVVNVPNCGSNSTNAALQPVFFWYWQQNPSNLAAVFCEPRIQLFDVTAYAALNNNSLTNVTIIDNYPKPNNVSGAPLNGIPYNGLIFNNSTDVNVQSRANSIRSGIPNAVFRQAQQAPGGLAAVFQNQTGFLTYTQRIYTQHLSLATKSNYFVLQNKTVDAVLTRLVPRLYVDPLPAHLLATNCMLVATVGLILHFLHFRQRRDIYLAHCPGSVASSVALTAHSGFGQLLLPYDDSATLSRSLAPFRFSLDRRTGAIVVDDSTLAYAGELPVQPVRDETMMTLIDRRKDETAEQERKDSIG